MWFVFKGKQEEWYSTISMWISVTVSLMNIRNPIPQCLLLCVVLYTWLSGCKMLPNQNSALARCFLYKGYIYNGDNSQSEVAAWVQSSSVDSVHTCKLWNAWAQLTQQPSPMVSNMDWNALIQRFWHGKYFSD